MNVHKMSMLVSKPENRAKETNRPRNQLVHNHGQSHFWHEHTGLALLCGGRSTRLGTDKGLFRPLADESMVARALRLLGNQFTEILVVVKDEEQAQLYRRELSGHDLPGQSLLVVPDQSATSAALSGIEAALGATKLQAIVVLPVDQVGVRARHLDDLIAGFSRSTAPAAAYLDTAASDILPFPSVWKKSSYERVAALREGGALSVKRALSELESCVVADPASMAQLRLNCNTLEEFRAYFGTPLHDPFNRRLHYLRFSLTEACNLSCTYCLPAGFPEWYRHRARLSLGDIEKTLGGFRQLGFRKVRFTGGEPTVHPHCLDAVRLAADLGFEDIGLSTNGLLLKDVRSWRDAGLNRINFSLDAIDAEEFFQITKSRDVDRVINAVDEAVQAGIETKINAVLLRSINLKSAEAMIDWALARPLTMRFIELMPTGLNLGFSEQERVLGSELEPFLTARGLRPGAKGGVGPNLRGPATEWTGGQHRGKIGLINPMSQNFCDDCNRLRVTARGALRLCLFGKGEAPLLLDSATTVAESVRTVIGRKPERHHLEDNDVGNVATFRTIGG